MDYAWRGINIHWHLNASEQETTLLLSSITPAVQVKPQSAKTTLAFWNMRLNKACKSKWARQGGCVHSIWWEIGLMTMWNSSDMVVPFGLHICLLWLIRLKNLGMACDMHTCFYFYSQFLVLNSHPKADQRLELLFTKAGHENCSLPNFGVGLSQI